ncbi:hypothetical protein HKBW3S42_02497, partial [Candidatus Hakubella thermalkaliphila]
MGPDRNYILHVENELDIIKERKGGALYR